MGDIKKITAENLKDITMSIHDYKNYRLLLETTEHMFEGRDYDDYEDIVSKIEDHIKEVLDYISNGLSEMYNDWSGKSSIKKNDYTNIDSYYEIIDAIDEQNNDISGECTHIIGIPGHIIDTLYVPKIFINEFVNVYGLFIVDGDVVYIK